MRTAPCTIIAILSAFVIAAPVSAQDAQGCTDHPLFTRMQGYTILRCSTKAFDAVEFRQAKGARLDVEGRVTEVLYQLGDGAVEASRLQIHRNFEAAVKKIGGTTLFNDDEGNLYLKVARDGSEYWTMVDAYISTQYRLVIVEKQLMAQQVTANAEAFRNDIRATGHAAVYGIHFDTARADIKPESTPALAEVAKMLAADAALKVYVVGHTDNAGTFDANMKLSQARAQSVVQALSTQHGIDAARLKAVGVGPVAPVQSNDSEAGRAKNRRVELVRQ
ncbi:MAG: OmpA family protein [Acidobacteria bacterium]|nr:OmpA family protein [Acidobacteriota bacterium]